MLMMVQTETHNVFKALTRHPESVFFCHKSQGKEDFKNVHSNSFLIFKESKMTKLNKKKFNTKYLYENSFIKSYSNVQENNYCKLHIILNRQRICSSFFINSPPVDSTMNSLLSFPREFVAMHL